MGRHRQTALTPLARGAQQRYLAPHFELADISIGTNVGDYAYCIARTRATNDFHGLGAFLIMNEQVRRTGGSGESTATNN
ncbi:hypothetical protein [Streptomyces sp. NPDC000878]